MAIDYRKRGPGVTTHLELVPVRSVWSENAGRDALAVLTFRVGMADETVPTHGITHLIEHLVMRTSFDIDVECNASVGLTQTQFYARGSANQVVAFLRRINAALLRLPVEHMDSERELIAVEESHGKVNMPAALYHFGAQRYGVVHFQQQLSHLQPRQLTDWVARYFVAENATLALSSMSPDQAQVLLPEGRFFAEPFMKEINRPPRLRYVDPSQRTIQLTSVMGSSWHLRALVGVLNKALMDRIRHKDHLAYGVRAELLSIDSNHAMVVITSDCIHGREQELVDALLDELHRLISVMPDDLIERSLRQLLDQFGDNPQDGVLDRALALLHRQQAPDSPSRFGDLDRLTTNSLQQQLAQLIANCVLRTPVPVQASGWEGSEALRVQLRGSGSEYTDGHGSRLSVLSDGMRLTQAEVQLSLSWSSVVASFVGEDDWTVVSRLGTTIRLQPSQWDPSGKLGELLLDRIPAATRIPHAWQQEA